MSANEARIADHDLEHLPCELREMARQWHESMSEQERAAALERLADTARETRNAGVLWALWAMDELRRNKH